jgi:hypothetical protein
MCFPALVLLLAAAACGDRPTTANRSDAVPAPALADTSARPESLTVAPLAAEASVAGAAPADTDRVVRDTSKAATADSTADSTKLAGKPRSRPLPPWPAPPPALPGALLPEFRVVAYYGNPLSKRMGVLGQYPPEEMMRRLEKTAAQWAEADSATPVRPALHLIVTVAQGKPGKDGNYRLRMTDSLIERVASWAESRGWLLFLDIQTGQSTIEAELPRILPYLTRPYVHLALDPEFSMKNGRLPGKYIGTMDAREINYAIRTVSDLVKANGLPPKMLVVHRFTGKMLTNASRIERDPNVQVVIDMDGFGPPQLKKSTWRAVVLRDPVQFTGFKLFYKNDKPMMTPKQVIELEPAPRYIQYQ